MSAATVTTTARTHGAAALWVVAVLLAGCTAPATGERDREPQRAPAATAPVRRQDLVTRDELDGTLGYRGALPLIAGRDGTLTRVPAAGTVLRRGDVVAEIDGVATRLLHGDRPAWRRLAVGCRGPDVRQLNDNLAALGYAARDELPGARFDWRTWHAVARWQDDLGVRRTGSVELGDVLFAPRALRIARLEARPGARVGAGQTFATATRTRQAVTVRLDAARRGDLRKGTPALVVLPDRTRIEATVRAVGRVVSPPATADDPATVQVVVALPARSARAAGTAARLQSAPVVVVVERVLATDVLTVPVGALMAHTGGGYAVERVTAGDTERIAVQPGQFADGLVEISGAVGEGDLVVVPS